MPAFPAVASLARHQPGDTRGVEVMLRIVADGTYWIEDAGGLPAALVTTLDDGTPIRAAEPWWAASRALLDLLTSDARHER